MTTPTSIRLACLLALSWAASAASEPKLLLKNGRIHSSQGVVAAMAVDDRGVIVALGTSADVAKQAGTGTKVIDLQGKAVLPGFHDMHVHPLYAGLSASRCSIAQGASLADFKKGVAACVSRSTRGHWIIGGQWDASALGRAPTSAMLDAVSPDNPVLLDDTSGHSALANKRALEAAGITKATSDPVGGIIERDSSGRPTGVLRESAIELVRKHVPVATEQEVRTALEWSLRKMLSYGITSFVEASVGFAAGYEQELAAYAALADAGTFKQKARLCLTWAPGEESGEAMIAARNRYSRERLSLDCVKIFLDGVPTDSHTAAMLDPYMGTVSGREDEASRKGMLMVKQDVLDAAVTRFDRMGLTVKFHAAGDAAVRAGLNAIEAARKANGFSGQMHDVGHCTFVSKEDLPRARAIGATFEASPYLWAPSPINDDITSAVGQPRIDRVWPIREMIDSGAHVIPGSDWSVVPSVNPWLAVEMLVTREPAGGGAKSFGKAEAITLNEAVDLFTVNSARHMGRINQVGKIESGMLADVIVLDRDPFTAPVKTLHEVTVAMTLIEGEVVYQQTE
jgi:predicted amidohydrolase YtcJ